MESLLDALDMHEDVERRALLDDFRQDIAEAAKKIDFSELNKQYSE